MLKKEGVTIASEGRDKGKVFIINEMPARKFEKWALKALTAMGQAGLEIPENIQEMGGMGLAILGFKSLVKIKFDQAEELMDDMFQYFEIQPDPNNSNIKRPIIDSDIEEATTLLKLRAVWWEMQTGFQVAGKLSTSTN